MIGTISPISPMDTGKLFGRFKGIQGHQNSCYLDATLFAMFSFTWCYHECEENISNTFKIKFKTFSAFDSILFRPPSSEDIPEYLEVQKVLLEEIINPLRQNYYVRADKVIFYKKLK